MFFNLVLCTLAERERERERDRERERERERVGEREQERDDMQCTEDYVRSASCWPCFVALEPIVLNIS